MILHYARSRGGGRRRRWLHHRQRARRPDARALRVRRLSGGRAAARLAGRRARDRSARGTKIVYARRLDGIRRACRSTAAARCAFRSIRFWPSPAIDAVGIDYYPPISDWRDGARPRGSAPTARSVYDVDYLRRQHRRRRGLRLVLCRRRRRATRRCARRSPTAPTASRGCSAQKDLVVLVVEPAYRARRRRRDRARPPGCRNRSRSGSPRSACPAVDKGANAAERLSRSEIVGIGLSAVLPRRARRSRCRRAGWRRSCPASIPRSARHSPAPIRSRPSMAGAWWTPTRIYRLGLGRAAFSGLSRFRRRVGGRRQLGDRPLDHGPARGRAARPADRAILRDFGFGDPAAMRRRRLRRRLCDRPADVGARRAGAAGAAVRRRCGGDAGGASRGSGRGGRAVVAPDEGRSRPAATSEPSLRLTRAQETELPQQVEVGFTDGETDYRRAAVASRRLSGASRRGGARRCAIVTRRAEAQRLADAWLQDLWAGREGAEFELSPGASSGRAGRRARRCRPRPVRGSTVSCASPTVRRARSRRAPSSRRVRAAAGACIERRCGGRRRSPASRRRSCSICRSPAASRPSCNISRSRPIPGRARWRSGDPANGASYRARPDRSTCRRSSGATLDGRSRPARSGAGITRAVLEVELASGALSLGHRTRRRLPARTCSRARAPTGAGRSFPPPRAELIGERS